ncbi:MAG: carboxypeptidase regulatory-like domain-containing protein, partial [Coriobacteriia bacterium]|nr:carboxypeptidase regulatory-like domain-containing protein [Coriobacteriia bacterium]
MSHHGRFARTAWIGLFALATLALAAMLLVPTAASADAPAPGWIEGRVTDSFGAGIAGVEVALFRAHDGVPVELSPGGAWSREATTTDEMGYYSVPVLEDGFVDVYFYDDSGAFSPGFFSAEGTASSPIASATPVEASLGTTTTAIDEMLLPTVSVSGTVRSTTGARLGGIRVYANQTSWSWRESSAVQATTDSRGRYSIPGVHANTTHTLLFSDLSSAYLPIYYAQKRSLASASPVGVAETATVGIDATLVPSGRISGTVRDSAGRPLSGIKVVGGALGDYYGYEYQPLAVTDSHGHYSIRGFTYGVAVVRAYDPRGRYRDVWYKSTPFRKDTFNASQLVVTTAGRTRTGIDFKLASAARVVGRVTSAGTGLAGAKVTAYRRLGDRWSWTDDALAAEDGTYVIGSLPGGIYLLKCDGPNNRLGRYAREYLGGSSSVLDATQISLPVSTTTTRADFDLAAGASVSGEIRRDDGTPMECYVEAHALDSEDIHYGVASAAGTYTVSGLPGGEYKIRYLPRTDARTAAGWYGQASESANATTLTVVADEATAGIDATLSAGFTISGAIHAPDGSGLSGYVQLRSGDDRGAPKWVQIGTDGEYEMTGVAAGQYSLAALPGDSSDEATVAAWHYPYGSASRGETFTIAGDFEVACEI